MFMETDDGCPALQSPSYECDIEVAIPPAAVSVKLIYPASLTLKSLFLLYDLAALTAKSENKKGLLMSEKAWFTRLPG